MYSVNLTRKFRRAALIALPLALMACGTDSITGVEPDNSSLARSASDGSNVKWIPAGTYLDPETMTYHYKGNGFGSNQTFSLTVTVWVAASYSCGGNTDAFVGVVESINGTTVGQATKRGQATGQLQLSPSGQLRCEAGLEPNNFRVQSIIGGDLELDLH